jgi:hypothetical protein
MLNHQSSSAPEYKQLSDFIHRFSTGWIALAALILFTLFITLVLPGQSAKSKAENGDIGSPDLSFYYTADDLYRMAEAYGEEGRQSYVRARYTFDLVWPLVYTFFLITGLSWVTRKAFATGSLWQRANLIPIGGALFDFLENLSTSVVMLRYPSKTGLVDGVATVFTMVKWVFVNLSFVLLLIAIVAGILAWLRSKK